MKESCSSTDVCILDGSFVVHYLKPRDCGTFGEYASKVFIPHIEKSLSNSKRLDIVWDTYREKSIKGQTREKRGTGQRRRITHSTVIPKDWQGFLRNGDNKTDLYGFLSNSVLSLIEPYKKEIVLNYGETSLSSTISKDMTDYEKCDHEEADIRIFSHVALSVRSGYDSFAIRSGDTDVVVLAISVCSQLSQIRLSMLSPNLFLF